MASTYMGMQRLLVVVFSVLTGDISLGLRQTPAA